LEGTEEFFPCDSVCGDSATTHSYELPLLFSSDCVSLYVGMSIESELGLEGKENGRWSMVMSAPQTLNTLGGRVDVARECSVEYSMSSGLGEDCRMWLGCSVWTAAGASWLIVSIRFVGGNNI